MMVIIFFLYISSISALSDKPNIVMIVADDMGFNDVGFHGGDIRTPNIDALAGHGIILNRHYTQPCCSPSRAALLTGKYPIRNGMQGLPIKPGHARGLPLKETIFPQYLKKLGYKSHLIGKWHVGYETRAHLPTHRGFDSFYGYLNGFIGYYDPVHTRVGRSGRDFRRDESRIWHEVYGHYLTEVLSKEAVRVINNHSEADGLFLMLNHAAPHFGNLDFRREAPPDCRNLTDRAILADMTRWLDNSVGEVVSTVYRKGILNNTIIIFISDNGAPTVDDLFHYNNHGSNWPLRGMKFSTHEGGIRTSGLIWSPTISHPRVSNDLFHISDWLPTLYTAAGGRISDLGNIDGLSHWESFHSGSPGPRKEVLLNIDEGWKNEALIQGKWKIIKNHGLKSSLAFTDLFSGVSGRDAPYDVEEVESSVIGRLLGSPKVPYDEVRREATITHTCLDRKSAEATDCHYKYCLFDIMLDSTECKDLSSDHPDVLKSLLKKLAEFKSVMVPAKVTDFDPKANPIFWNDYWNPWMDNGSPAIRSNFIIFPTLFIILWRWL